MAGKTAAASLKSIEQLKEEQNVSDAVFEGVKAANGWKAGRQVEEKMFCSAVKAFLEAPVDGRTADREAKG